MGTLLGFPLAMPLGGVRQSGVRIRRLRGRTWRLNWTPISVGYAAAYMIAVDGQHYMTVNHEPPVDILLETTVDGFSPSPLIEVSRIPLNQSDQGFFIPGYFDTIIPNRILVKWNPPASVTDVFKYRIFWDRGDGTVIFDKRHTLGEILEDGSTSYEISTPALTTGTFKFVIRTVDAIGNESTNVAELSQAITTLPGTVTSFALSYSGATDKATLTWADPSDIGSGTVKIFDNGGNVANPFPDYDTVVATIAAGTQTFTTAVLTEGLWVFGIRVNDGTNEEPNTNVLVRVRLDASADEITTPPPAPFVEAFSSPSGKVRLYAHVLPIDSNGTAVKAQFFKNDGAGGAIDFSTPISPGFVNLVEVGQFLSVTLESSVLPETEHIFSARSFTSGNQPSLNGNQVKATPDSTSPPQPVSVTTSTVRN